MLPLPKYEYRLWIPGIPKSEQSKGKFSQGYTCRIQDVARTQFSAPVETPVEITIVFKDFEQRPDVDNVPKRIIDALKGIVFHDDWQVRESRVAVMTDEIAARAGNQHLTFQRLQSGQEFLIVVLVDPPNPAIERLRSS